MIRQFARSVRQIGVLPAVQMAASKSFVLPKVRSFPPIPLPADGPCAIHMLLHGAKIFEGMWALYSLLEVSSQRLPIVVHDDGTLSSRGHADLRAQFPGIRIVERCIADRKLASNFAKFGLRRCALLRSRLVFALKLFDVCEFAESNTIILLDSDVLFFRPPLELLNRSWGGIHVYQRDFARSYCLPAEEMTRLEGAFPVAQLNPGIMRVSKSLVDFERIETYLGCGQFFDSRGEPDYFAELTIWALEVSQQPNAELPHTYGMNTSPWVMPEAVAGHFCGGGYWASTFYTRGISDLARRDRTGTAQLDV